MITTLRAYLRDTGGVTSIEYALLAAMIALAIVLTGISDKLSSYFNEVSSALK